jgi:hypothetical protein
MSNTFLIVFFFVSISTFSCSNKETLEKDTETTVIDKEDESETETETPEVEVVTVELSEEAKPFAKEWAMKSFTHTDGKVQDNIDNSFLTLGEDGKFVELFSTKEVATGTWNIMKEGNSQVLVLTHTSGDMVTKLREGKEKLMIKEISADKMVTADNGGKMTETFMVVKK